MGVGAVLSSLVLGFSGLTGTWEPLFPRTDVFLLPAPEKSAAQEVRVRIFPHPTSLPPQGLDPVLDRTALVTDGVCEARDAVTDHVVASGTRLEFAAATLREALEVTCNAPARVERAAGLVEYSYRGRFTVRRETYNGRAVVEIVNTLPLETYLRGVVPIEMPKTWAPEALRAQAIAARTYALFHLALTAQETPGRGWDFDDTVMYQAYTGTRDEAASTDAAIATTEGVRMTYQGQIIQAFFSADAGGHTEDAENIWNTWGKVPYCRGKPETFPRSELDPARWGTWTVTLSWSEISTRLGIPGIKSLTVQSDEIAPSGRAVWFRAMGARNKKYRLWGDETRRKLKLRSTLLTATMSSTGVVFKGIGYGHGVGMSQVGAQVLASKQALTAEQILTQYYTGITLER